MQFLVGNSVKKDGKVYIILQNINENFMIQNIVTNERNIVLNDWFIGVSKQENIDYILRTPYLCAKFYRTELNSFYREHKKDIKKGIIDFNKYKYELYEDVLQKGLIYCVYSQDSIAFENYKNKIERELKKEIEKNEKNM